VSEIEASCTLLQGCILKIHVTLNLCSWKWCTEVDHQLTTRLTI